MIADHMSGVEKTTVKEKEIEVEKIFPDEQ